MKDTPAPTAARAYALTLRADTGMQAVILAWADEVIGAHPSPPSALLDVALSARDQNAMLSALNELSAPMLDKEGFRLLCMPLIAYLTAHSARTGSVTALLTEAADESALPAEVEAEARAFDVALDLAREGYGSERVVRRDLLGFLASHA